MFGPNYLMFKHNYVCAEVMVTCHSNSTKYIHAIVWYTYIFPERCLTRYSCLHQVTDVQMHIHPCSKKHECEVYYVPLVSLTAYFCFKYISECTGGVVSPFISTATTSVIYTPHFSHYFMCCYISDVNDKSLLHPISLEINTESNQCLIETIAIM